MDRVQGEPFWFDCPLFADELVGRESFEGLQSSPEVAGADEVGEVLAQLVVIVVMEAFDVQRENRPPDCFLTRLIPQPSEPRQCQRGRNRAGRL